jgi:AraC-like DNA-binding protein
MNRRIERAKQMLLDPNQSSVDIALQTRFYSQSHFTEALRRRVGLSPPDGEEGQVLLLSQPISLDFERLRPSAQSKFLHDFKEFPPQIRREIPARRQLGCN